MLKETQSLNNRVLKGRVPCADHMTLWWCGSTDTARQKLSKCSNEVVAVFSVEVCLQAHKAVERAAGAVSDTGALGQPARQSLQARQRALQQLVLVDHQVERLTDARVLEGLEVVVHVEEVEVQREPRQSLQLRPLCPT